MTNSNKIETVEFEVWFEQDMKYALDEKALKFVLDVLPKKQPAIAEIVPWEESGVCEIVWYTVTLPYIQDQPPHLPYMFSDTEMDEPQ